MKVQHVTVSDNSDHNSCVSLTMVWAWNFLLSRQTWQNLQHGLRLHFPDFYSKCTVNIGSVSIADYFVAEAWLHACRRATVT